ncbi:hypothetical protein DYB31_005855 [Aphanomyces astaci]|uniref:Uncharacterized protein n=3 Tax=Aphanomyces astaci TaxID=112090 RepID=A0A397F5L3_APHAT|nr:hypothetical protein DYB31_005855 [Aphanomyces astaci]
MKDQVVSDLTGRVADLERRLAHDKAEYEKAVSNRDQSIDALQSKVRDLKRETNVLTDDYESVSEEKHELEEQLDKEHTQLINLQDELAEMDTLVADLRAEIDRLNQRNEQDVMAAEEAQHTAAATQQALEDAAADTAAKLIALTQANEALEDALAAAVARHATGATEYQGQVDALKLEHDAHVTSLERRQQVVDLECATLQAALAQAQAAAASTSTAQEDLEIKVAQLEAANTAQANDWANVERGWKKRVQELTDRCDEAVAAAADVQLGRDHAVAMNAQLTSEVETLNQRSVWNPVIHAVCLFAGIAFGMKAFQGPVA